MGSTLTSRARITTTTYLTYDPWRDAYTRTYSDDRQVHFNPDTPSRHGGTHDHRLEPDGLRTAYTYNADGTLAAMNVTAHGEKGIVVAGHHASGCYRPEQERDCAPAAVSPFLDLVHGA